MNLFFPETEKLVKELKKKHFKLGLITSSGIKTVKIFFPNSFRKNFDAVIALEDVGHIKPSAEPVLKMLKKLKIKPSEALLVGDAVSDLRAARKAKVKSIGVTTGLGTRKELLKEKPIAVVNSLKEIRKFIN